jgi:hypothetical protein
MALKNNEYKKYDLQDLELLATNERPIPGQSLTTNTEQKLPWEGPTQFSDVQSAIDAIFMELTEDEVYFSIIELVNNDLPIGDITKIILYDGFTKGMWNPDLMLLLIEPVMYIILSLAERAGINNPLIYNEERDEASSLEDQAEGIKELISLVQDKLIPKVQKRNIPASIVEKVEEFVPPKQPSLLEQPEETEELPRESLLDKGIQQ